MILFLAFSLLFISGLAYQLKFDLNIKEGNARFVENIETDLQQNTVRYDVPAHNDVYETHRLQDFKAGLQVTCFPALKHCRMREMKSTTVANAGNLTESLVHSWNQGVNSISSADSVLVKEYFIWTVRLLTHFYGEKLRYFYQSFEYPLFREIRVPNEGRLVNMTSKQGQRHYTDRLCLRSVLMLRSRHQWFTYVNVVLVLNTYIYRLTSADAEKIEHIQNE
ncbi:unnamed protein product [Mytilus edulis]|uniref:Uncharacterized protein n=1 Tax=Mytilus edulis TaxID=6550 RepID=A0A8S3U1R4_MYTED|nr:unnamed protein product [Mytilus edulis]